MCSSSVQVGKALYSSGAVQVEKALYSSGATGWEGVVQ